MRRIDISSQSRYTMVEKATGNQVFNRLAPDLYIAILGALVSPYLEVYKDGVKMSDSKIEEEMSKGQKAYLQLLKEEAA